MATKNFEAEIIINKPREEVFNFTIDLDNLEAWNNTIDTQKITSGPVSMGTEFTEQYKYRGKLVTVTNTITKFDNPKTWGYEGKMGDYEVKAVYKFIKLKSGNTKVKYNGSLNMSGPFQISMWFHLFSGILVNRQLKRNLQKLKELLETN